MSVILGNKWTPPPKGRRKQKIPFHFLLMWIISFPLALEYAILTYYTKYNLHNSHCTVCRHFIISWLLRSPLRYQYVFVCWRWNAVARSTTSGATNNLPSMTLLTLKTSLKIICYFFQQSATHIAHFTNLHHFFVCSSRCCCWTEGTSWTTYIFSRTAKIYIDQVTLTFAITIYIVGSITHATWRWRCRWME